MVDRIAFPVLIAVVFGYLAFGCADPDFTIAEPLAVQLNPGVDAAMDTDPSATDTAVDAADPDEAASEADAPIDAPPPDTAPDAAPDTAHPPDATPPPPDTAAIDAAPDTTGMASTPGTVQCTTKSPSACAAFVCDESADCGGARCCLRPDGAGSTCDCSGASMDGWTILCLTEGDCYGGKHCTPWIGWDHHGRCQ